MLEKLSNSMQNYETNLLSLPAQKNQQKMWERLQYNTRNSKTSFCWWAFDVTSKPLPRKLGKILNILLVTSTDWKTLLFE